jgi:Carboxypeptidase regulatory-like domain
MIGAAVPRSLGVCVGLLGCLILVPHGTRAQGSTGTAGITGRLLDRTSREPLQGAAIYVLGTPVSLRSSATGEFTHTGLKPGTYVMQVRALGYAPGSWVIELAERETLSVVIEMDVKPIDLPSVTVETPTVQRGMAGFALRRAAGRGVYITEDDIKRANAARLSDLLRNVSGIRLICRFNGCRVRMARNDCQPDFFLDGLSANNSTFLEMSVVGVTGVEIYRTITETPVDFLRGNNTCGTIAIWTKSGP